MPNIVRRLLASPGVIRLQIASSALTPPEPAITADEPWHSHDHEVSLED